ncbi:hypothetical protein JHK82_018228 [Glycine max]|uniref:40S ribosomal protein S3-3 n=2 Tax=Glycine soja TaxID=3848 RepID=A0A445JVI7_GLYSO|nr:hypothetical protein JHK85_018655 [Glycine max]KAG5037416.1 hypothetical protein JHK86_018256 [Glycine max]KAG5142533.1 hypothetical protein JHK82_018228 [Glycine max]RZC02469.1 40S ribosomal protein S3-3 [Glycine soja]
MFSAPSSISDNGDPNEQEEKADGVFFVELNEVLTRELAKDGYSGVEVRVTPMRTKIIIKATKTQVVLASCEKGRRIRELTSVFQKTASMVVVAGTGEGVFIVRET